MTVYRYRVILVSNVKNYHIFYFDAFQHVPTGNSSSDYQQINITTTLMEDVDYQQLKVYTVLSIIRVQRSHKLKCDNTGLKLRF